MKHLAFTAIFAATLAFATRSFAETDSIRVGEVASLTGKEASYGQASHKGTILAIEEINAAGGVLGRKLELFTEDNQSKVGESATAARKLLFREKVVAILGEFASGRSIEMAPIAQQAKIPMISPGSTNPAVTEKGTFIFRICFIDPFQGSVMAKFSHETLNVRRVAILTDESNAYSKGLSKYFREKFLALGGEIVADMKYSGGDKDFKAQLTAIRAAKPDGILCSGYYTENALIAVQARQLGLTVPLFGGDAWESTKTIEIAGEAAVGVYFSTHYSQEDQSPRVQTFLKKFRERWDGETPDAMAALGYDSALVLADAIKRAGTTDSEKLRAAIATTKDFPGVTGNITLDENRNAVKAAVILTVKDGAFHFVKSVAP